MKKSYFHSFLENGIILWHIKNRILCTSVTITEIIPKECFNGQDNDYYITLNVTATINNKETKKFEYFMCDGMTKIVYKEVDGHRNVVVIEYLLENYDC